MSGFPGVPNYLADHPEWMKRVARVVNNLLIGKLNVTSLVTLDANVTSTTITDPRIGVETGIILIPTTLNAAGALATTYIEETNRINGEVVVSHANTATTDRVFRAVYLG